MSQPPRSHRGLTHGIRYTSSIQLLRRLFQVYLKPYRGYLASAIGLMVVVALTTAAIAIMIEPVINTIFERKNQNLLYLLAVATTAIFMLRGFATYGHNILLTVVSQRVLLQLRKQLHAHLLGTELKFFHATPSGHLIARLVNDIQNIQSSLASCLINVGRNGLTLIVLMGIMFYQDWILALCVFLAFPAGAIIGLWIGKKIRILSTRYQEVVAQFTAILNQTFQNIRSIQAYRKQEYEQQRIGGIAERLYRLRLKSTRIRTLGTPLMEICSGLAITILIIYIGSRIIENTHTAGSLISFILAFLLAYEPMRKFNQLSAQMQSGLASADRVFEVLDRPAQITTLPHAISLCIDRPTLRFQDVSFSYEHDQETILGAIDLKISAGQTVALVGPSGAGKSTLLNLIPRFYDPINGHIFIDDVDIRNVTLESLRSHIALVSQEALMFDDTLWNNITYGRTDATPQEVENVACAAAIHDFIISLPNGYDTFIGEQGIKISAGQRQRIAIACALLCKAPILLLDEATSALDARSERILQETLFSHRYDRTTLIIAHRLSTIIDADEIYVLNHGRIVERGNHANLIAHGGLYHHLYGLQEQRYPTH